jgi:hypothetical protein
MNFFHYKSMRFTFYYLEESRICNNQLDTNIFLIVFRVIYNSYMKKINSQKNRSRLCMDVRYVVMFSANLSKMQSIHQFFKNQNKHYKIPVNSRYNI